MKEIWEVVNENGEFFGELYERYGEKPFPDGMYFRVVEVWVKVGKLLLITQRHPKKWQGLTWEVSGGGVLAGEDIACAASRELFEETGVSSKASELELLGVEKMQPALIYSYKLTLEDLPRVNIDTNEVVDYKFVTREDFEKMQAFCGEGTQIRYKKYCDRIFD